MTFDHFCCLSVILCKAGELVLPGKWLTCHCNVDAVGWASEIIYHSTRGGEKMDCEQIRHGGVLVDVSSCGSVFVDILQDS